MPIEALKSHNDDILLHADGISLSFGKNKILNDIDLTIKNGEIVTIIGPNGAGKTTLIKILLGLVAAEHGKITKAKGLKIGYVPQKLHIDPILPLSVMRLICLTKRHSRNDVIDALKESGVDDLIDNQVQTLSGGQFQRVLLARALLLKPDLLVLDEPVQGVDFTGEAALYDLISKVRDKHGCAILMVSHDLHIVMASTDRVICLNRHICCVGKPDEVVQDFEFKRLFGQRSDAFALYSHFHDHEHDLQDGGSHIHDDQCNHNDNIQNPKDKNNA